MARPRNFSRGGVLERALPVFWKHGFADASLQGLEKVLPFVDMSEKKDQEYFADGMAEEILDLLATIPALKMIGRRTAVAFEQARRTAETALQRDPTLALPHVVLAGIHTSYDFDWAAADKELQRAIRFGSQ
jgi:hypothetical protein